MQEKQQSAIWRKQTLYVQISSITDRRSVNTLDDCDEADEKERRLLSLADPNEIMKTPAVRKSKYWQFPLSQPTVAPLAHRWQRRKKTNCLLHFRVIHLRNLSMNPSMRRSQDQQLLSLCLWLLEAFSWLRNRSIVLVNAGLSLSRMILNQINKGS